MVGALLPSAPPEIYRRVPEEWGNAGMGEWGMIAECRVQAMGELREWRNGRVSSRGYRREATTPRSLPRASRGDLGSRFEMPAPRFLGLLPSVGCPRNDSTSQVLAPSSSPRPNPIQTPAGGSPSLLKVSAPESRIPRPYNRLRLTFGTGGVRGGLQ